MQGLVQSLTIGKLCQNQSGLLALANDPHHFEWVSREHTIQISDRRLLLGPMVELSPLPSRITISIPMTHYAYENAARVCTSPVSRIHKAVLIPTPYII